MKKFKKRKILLFLSINLKIDLDNLTNLIEQNKVEEVKICFQN